MRLAWMTDVHLNFLEPLGRRQFLESARDQADAFVLSGDIAESPSIVGVLTEMADVWQKPTYFVLGNHDFYRGSIGRTRVGVANYLPHFACKAVGAVMRRIMEANPQSRLLVLCGHTHGSGEVQILENLQVLTGGAEYGNPVVQRFFDIG